MKKRILSILTALCLCLTLLPTAALADGEAVKTITQTTDAGTTTTTISDGTSSSTAWTTTTVGTDTYYTLPTGSYKLDSDVTLDHPLKIPGTNTVTLDLNGHILTANVTVDPVTAVTAPTDGKLTLQDSVGTGTLTSSSGTTLQVNSECSLTLESGTVSAGTSGTAITVSAGASSGGTTTFTMNGGTVSAASGGTAINIQGDYTDATMNANGGAVYGKVTNGSTITRSEGVTATATTFYGDVNNQGTISGGTFCGDVTNGDGSSYMTINGGTFYGTVTNRTNGAFVKAHPLVNNGVVVFATDYEVAGSSITGGTEEAKKNFIRSLSLSGTGYVCLGDIDTSTSAYYSNSGTALTKLSSTLTINSSLASGSATVDTDGYSCTSTTDSETGTTTYTLTLKNVVLDKIVFPNTADVTIEIYGEVIVNDIENDGSATTGYKGSLLVEGKTHGELPNPKLSMPPKVGDSGNLHSGTIAIDNGGLTLKGLDAEIFTVRSGSENGDMTLDKANVTVGAGGVNLNNTSVSTLLQYGLILQNNSQLTVDGSASYVNGASDAQIYTTNITIHDTSTITLINTQVGNAAATGLSTLPSYCPKDEDAPYHIGDGYGMASSYLLLDKNGQIVKNLTLRKYFTVTFDANGGSGTMTDVTGISGSYTLPGNGFTAPSGMQFKAWSVGGVEKTAGATIDVSANTTVTAVWESIPTPPTGTTSTSGTTYYTITATAGTGGSISPSGAVSVRRGNDKTFTVSPAQGYVLSDLLVDGQSVGALTSYTFANVKTSHTIKAVFAPDTGNQTGADRPVGLNSTDHVAYIQGYADGTVRPNANITRAQVAVILYRLLTPERLAEIETDAHAFTDMTAADWYSHEVATMANGGYITGYADGRFGGNDPITRAQFVTILTRFLGQRDVDCAFTDVPASHWAYDAIAAAVDAGWISGYADGTFRPDQSVTRAQVVTILNRALDRGVDADSALTAGYKTFLDNPAAAWHYYDILEAANGHDYTGHRPSENWTRLK